MSTKTYKCPFCSYRATRENLGSHIEEEHEECIPKGMTANQIVFNTINHKDHGTCVVCKRPTKWSETACKYDRLCGRPQCQKALRDAYKKNMLRVHGKTTLLDDPEQQEKMLANRRISGKYKFTDGGYHVFTGKYEEKALEFMDKVMGFKSTDILSPGPTIEYIYKGKKLKWITDILLIPFNLVIEVKDGGSNPNNREMISYREKQLAKEQMITNMGKFNYLRLTDNDFSQLLGIVAELKAQMIDDSDENKKVIINVNEEVDMLQETYIAESTNGYSDAKRIYDSLSDEDKKFVSPNGRFVDSPALAYRYIHKVGKDVAGFIDCYKYNGKSTTSAFIVYAVSSKFRGKGISKILLDKAVVGCRAKGYKKLIYKCDSKNTASAKAAESYGFKLVKSSKNQKSYEMPLGSVSITEAVSNKFTKRYSGFDDLCKSIKTPAELNDWYNVNNIRWFTQGEQSKRRLAIHSVNEDDVIVAWPDEIIRSHAGICFDHAIFMHLLCNRNSIENRMLYIGTIATNTKDTKYLGHIVCLYKIKDSGVYIFNYRANNEGSIQGPFGSYEEAEAAYKKYYFYITSLFLKMMPGNYRGKKVFSHIQKENLNVYDEHYNDKYVTQVELVKRIPKIWDMFAKVNKECHTEKITWLDEILSKLDKFKLSNILKSIKGIFGESAPLDDSVSTYEGEYHSTDPNYESLIESVGVEHKERINYFISPKSEGAEILLANLACAGKDRFKEWFDPSEKFFSIIGKATASFYEKAGKEYEFLIIFNPKDTDADKRYNANQLCNYIQSMATGNGLVDTMRDKLFTYSGIMHIQMAKDLWLSYLILFGGDEIEKIFLVAYNMDTEWMELIPMPVPPMNTYRDSIAMEANLIPIPKPKDIKYIKSAEGIDNPYIMYDNKQYRVRVETLIFDKHGDVLVEMQDPKKLNKYGTNYKLPGGGLDKGRALDEQAEAECNEEALVVTKNRSYTGMTYFQNYEGKYPEWQKKKLWPLGLKYEGSLTFIFVAEYDKKFTGHIEDVDKDDFYQKAKYVGVDTIDWRAEHEEAIDFYFNHRDAIREGVDMDLNEFAGPGGMTPAPDLSYVTQYGPVHRDTGTGIMDMNVEGYAVSNDILTKNILTQDKSGMVKKENTEEFLKGRKLRVFQFRSDPEGLRIIENAIGTVQPRGFIYEALTGKKLLSDDQILCDESCTEVSPIDIGSEATSYLQTVAEQLKSIKGKKDHEFPLTNPHMIKEADAITEGLKDVVVMENQYGVYAKNAKTGMRTAYYQRIKDIPAKVVAKKNVKH